MDNVNEDFLGNEHKGTDTSETLLPRHGGAQAAAWP